MKTTSLGKRILASVLVLVMMIGMFPSMAFAADSSMTGPTQARPGSTKLSYQQVEGIDANLMHPST